MNCNIPNINNTSDALQALIDFLLDEPYDIKNKSLENVCKDIKDAIEKHEKEQRWDEILLDKTKLYPDILGIIEKYYENDRDTPSGKYYSGKISFKDLLFDYQFLINGNRLNKIIENGGIKDIRNLLLIIKPTYMHIRPRLTDLKEFYDLYDSLYDEYNEENMEDFEKLDYNLSRSDYVILRIRNVLTPSPFPGVEDNPFEEFLENINKYRLTKNDINVLWYLANLVYNIEYEELHSYFIDKEEPEETIDYNSNKNYREELIDLWGTGEESNIPDNIKDIIDKISREI